MDLINIISLGNLILLVVLIGTIVAWKHPGRSGRVWLTILTVLLLFIMFVPVDDWIKWPLETRFPLPEKLPDQIDGFVVLGGTVDAPVADDRNTIAVGGGAERIMVPIALAIQRPEVRVVMLGSDAGHKTITKWLNDIGFNTDRVQFILTADDVFDSASLSFQELQPKPNDNWILVTSALQMPRAVGAFRKVGWSVIPYPVDYSMPAHNLRAMANFSYVLENLNEGVAEWIRLIVYYATGRLDDFLPSPSGRPQQES